MTAIVYNNLGIQVKYWQVVTTEKHLPAHPESWPAVELRLGQWPGHEMAAGVAVPPVCHSTRLSFTILFQQVIALHRSHQ